MPLLSAIDGAHVHDVVGSVLVNVRLTSVSGHVHTRHLVLRGDTQQMELVQGEKQRAHRHRNPPEDCQDLDNLGPEQLATASHEQTVWSTAIATVDLQDVVLLREEPNEEKTPRSAPAMQLSGFQRVVKMQASCKSRPHQKSCHFKSNRSMTNFTPSLKQRNSHRHTDPE